MKLRSIFCPVLLTFLCNNVTPTTVTEGEGQPPVCDSPPPVVEVQHIDLFCGYEESDIDLMAAVVFYEAGNQDMLGKQLVADTILNRVDSPCFPNTIKGVIDQKGQFKTARKAHKIAPVNIPIECYGAVISQLEVRENYEVMFFSRGYGCGEPLFKYGDHCFSGL